MGKIKYGKPVRVASNDVREYRRTIRRLVDDPVLKGFLRGLEQSALSLQTIQLAVRYAAAEAAEAIAESGMTRLTAYYQAFDEAHLKRFIRAHRQGLGVDIRPLLKDTSAVGERWIARNVNLIRLKPPEILPKIHSAMTTLYGSGEPLSKGAMEKFFRERWDYEDYPLRRVARDQCSKLNAQLSEFRQREVGVTHYRWSTAADDKVRKQHQQNDGLIFAWDDPPATGHPSVGIQCRCVAIAVMDADVQASAAAAVTAAAGGG